MNHDLNQGGQGILEGGRQDPFLASQAGGLNRSYPALLVGVRTAQTTPGRGGTAAFQKNLIYKGRQLGPRLKAYSYENAKASFWFRWAFILAMLPLLRCPNTRRGSHHGNE